MKGSTPLLFTFAVLDQGIAVVTRFAVLALWSCGVVKAAQALAGQAVAGVTVCQVNVAIARTRLTVGAWQC